MYQRFTRAQLRTALRERTELTPFWTDDDANLALNQALRLWNALTGYWRKRIIAFSAGDTPMLPIPGTLVQRTSITYQGRPMVPTSLTALSDSTPNWWLHRINTGGTVPTRPLLWAPIGLSLVAIWPATLLLGSYDVDGIRDTPVLAADGDFVDIGDEELSILLGYGVHVLSLKGTGTILAATEPLRRAFLAEASKRNGRLLSQVWYRRYERQSEQHMLRSRSVPPEAQIDAIIAAVEAEQDR